MIKISDYSPNVNITEASFDRFSITNYDVSELVEPQISDILFFPNPANHYLTIQGLEIGNTLTFIDLKGNSLIQYVCSKETESIDLSNLSEGMYFIKYKGKSYKMMKN